MAMFGQDSSWVTVVSGAAPGVYGDVVELITLTTKATEWLNVGNLQSSTLFIEYDIRSADVSLIDGLEFGRRSSGSDEQGSANASIPLQVGFGKNLSLRIKDDSAFAWEHLAHFCITDVPLFRGILSRSQSSGLLDRVAGTAPKSSAIANTFGAWKTLITSLNFDVKWLSLNMLHEGATFASPNCLFELGIGPGPTAIIPGGYKKSVPGTGRDLFTNWGWPIGNGSFLAGEKVSIRCKDNLAAAKDYDCGITVNG